MLSRIETTDRKILRKNRVEKNTQCIKTVIIILKSPYAIYK